MTASRPSHETRSGLLYFAYGSNLNWGQFQARCPSARFHSRVLLPGHSLVFPRNSVSLGGGVAGIEPREDAHVWGVVYEIAHADLSPLDDYEGHAPGGVGNHYERGTIGVLHEGDEGRALEVMTYFANPEPTPAPPSRYYMDIILGGARHWDLPAHYVQALENIPVGG